MIDETLARLEARIREAEASANPSELAELLARETDD